MGWAEMADRRNGKRCSSDDSFARPRNEQLRDAMVIAPAYGDYGVWSRAVIGRTSRDGDAQENDDALVATPGEAEEVNVRPA